jgi:hypothetical protein
MLSPAQNFLLRPDVDRIQAEKTKRLLGAVAGFGYMPAEDRSLYELYRAYRNNGGIPDLLFDAGLSVNYNLVHSSEFLTTSGWSKYAAGGTTVQANITLAAADNVMTIGSDPTSGATWNFFGMSQSSLTFVAGQSYTFSGIITTTIPNFILNILTNAAIIPTQVITFLTPGTHNFSVTATALTSGTTTLYYRTPSGSGSATQVTFSLSKVQIAITTNTYRPRSDATVVKPLNLGTVGASGDGTFVNGTSANMIVNDPTSGLAYEFVAASSQFHQTSFTYNTSTLTLMSWIKRNAFGNKGIWGSAVNGVEVRLDATARLSLVRRGAAVIAVGTTVIPQSVWTHVAVTFDAGAFNLFVNGVSEASGTTATTFTANTLVYGQSGATSNFMDGELDLGAYHSKGLSPEQIANIYNTQKSKFGL